MKRLLIVKLSSFGDVIHTFPAITDLKAAMPDLEVDWVVDRAFAPIAKLHPGVNEVLPIGWRRLRWPPDRWPRFVAELIALRRRLRRGKYDLVVDLQGLMKSAFIARRAGAPIAGYDKESIREPAAASSYQRNFAIAKGQHAVERSRQLLAAAIGYAVPAAEGSFGLSKPAREAVPTSIPESYGVIVHSASWDTKLWQDDHWRELIRGLTAVGKNIVLPWGTEREKARATRLTAGIDGAIVLPRMLNGAELAALFAGAEFSVGLDSGPMHLTAAFEVPGVWLYGPTDPVRTGPYGSGQIVIRSTYPEAPCFRRRCDHEPGGHCCMDRIDVATVLNAVEKLQARA